MDIFVACASEIDERIMFPCTQSLFFKAEKSILLVFKKKTASLLNKKAKLLHCTFNYCATLFALLLLLF